MKHKIKGKMVKTKRDRVTTDHVIYECTQCSWEGEVSKIDHGIDGQNLCPDCGSILIVFED